jgi:cell division protein FtsL
MYTFWISLLAALVASLAIAVVTSRWMRRKLITLCDRLIKLLKKRDRSPDIEIYIIDNRRTED